MNDMTQVIVPKSDQINADDLIAGDMVITITGVNVSPGQEQPVSIQFEGSGKVFRPCKSMCRVLVAAWGPDAKAYTGRSLTLYRDPTVKWGGMQVGGIRIRSMTHIQADMTMMLSESKSNRKPFRVTAMEPPKPAQPAAPEINPQHQAEARSAAARGKDAFSAWWQANPDKRASAKPILPELQEACAKADAAIEADPFNLPPVTAPHTLTEADRDRIAAEARAQSERDAEGVE
jgi:hypothetical protein